MEQEPGFSEREGLELIQSMINKAHDRFYQDGHLYILWGWVVALCSVAQFIMLQVFYYKKHYLVWLLCLVAVLYQVIYMSRKSKTKRVQTYTQDILKYVWLSFAIVMFLMGFFFGRVLGADYYRMINPCFLALYGIPTFLSGIIVRFKPLVVGGICCWILAIGSTFVPYHYQLLFLTAAMVVAWLIPGYRLRMKYKAETR